jgi:hypothetical protein
MSDNAPSNPPAPPAPSGDTTPPAPPAPEFKAPADQAELDRIVEARLAREREKYKGHDELKTKAAKWDEYESSNKTPDQKAVDDAKAQAEAETTQRFLRRLVTTETKSIATALGFNDPSDALSVINAEQLPVKDEEPDSEAIKKLVEKLATDKPYLVASGRRQSSPKQKPREGQPLSGDEPQKGRAAAALRQLRKPTK